MEHVGLQRSDLEKIEDTTDTEHGQLVLSRQRHPGDTGRLLGPGRSDLAALRWDNHGLTLRTATDVTRDFKGGIPQCHCRVVIVVAIVAFG